MGCSLLTNCEILSPAGDKECLAAAINCGADAVYLGGTVFSARANAANFDNSALADAVRCAHLHGVKVYVALNTLILNSEIEKAFDFIKFCYTIGVDALIVQDLGIAYIIGKYFPDFRIHASTQLTVHSLGGVINAAKIGFKRVVLSRELSYDEIKHITENTDTEIEVFVHGALCMCYSGQCLMSSMIGGRSGNRGACAQPCRLPYTVVNSDGKPMGQKDKYYMSLKDLCLIDDIDKLNALGVSSLKIEGRMKNKEYVALATHMYDKYRNGGKVADADKSILENIFSRNGFTNGYACGNTGAHMLNIDRSNDNIYKEVRPEVKKLADSLLSTQKTTGVSCTVRAVKSKLPEVSFSLGGVTAICRGEQPIEPAVKTATDSDRIINQVSKLGGTPFHVEDISAEIDHDINIPIKTINELRRNAADLLADKLARSFCRQSDAVFADECFHAEKGEPTMTASVMNSVQAHAAYDAGFDRIYIDIDTYESDKEFFDMNDDVFALMLPTITRNFDKKNVSDCNLKCVCISNISQLGEFDGKYVVANMSMNVFNKYTAAMLAKLGVNEICASPELTLSQIQHLESPLPLEVIVYGRLTLMTVRNCLRKSACGKCDCRDEFFFIRDRKNMLFPVMSDKTSCTNAIYNSVPVYMGDRMDEVSRCAAKHHRFIFTTETADEINGIVKMYEKREKYPNKAFTRGHWYRGVESRED